MILSNHPLAAMADWPVMLCPLLFPAALWLAHRGHRLLSARQSQCLKENRTRREQAAHELGDSLLQDFQALVFRFQTAIDLVEEGPARQMLEQIVATSEQVLTQGREQALNLSTQLPDEDDFVDSLVETCGDLQQQANAHYRVIVHGKVRPLSNRHRDAIYQIGREALSNAFAHSHAAEIEAEIFYNTSGLHCCFRDDGHGIDPHRLSLSPGMHRMRESVESIGASLDIRSRPNTGTELELRVPSALAYQSMPDRRDCMLYRLIMNREE